MNSSAHFGALFPSTLESSCLLFVHSWGREVTKADAWLHRTCHIDRIIPEYYKTDLYCVQIYTHKELRGVQAETVS